MPTDVVMFYSVHGKRLQIGMSLLCDDDRLSYQYAGNVRAPVCMTNRCLMICVCSMVMLRVLKAYPSVHSYIYRTRVTRLFRTHTDHSLRRISWFCARDIHTTFTIIT